MKAIFCLSNQLRISCYIRYNGLIFGKINKKKKEEIKNTNTNIYVFSPGIIIIIILNRQKLGNLC